MLKVGSNFALLQSGVADEAFIINCYKQWIEGRQAEFMNKIQRIADGSQERIVLCGTVFAGAELRRALSGESDICQDVFGRSIDADELAASIADTETYAIGLCTAADVLRSLNDSSSSFAVEFSSAMAVKGHAIFGKLSQIGDYFAGVVSKGSDIGSKVALLLQTGAVREEVELQFLQNDVSEYTGASPMGLYLSGLDVDLSPDNFNEFMDTAIATTSLLIKKASSWIGSKARKYWRKAKAWFTRTFDDPVDLIDRGEGTDASVEGGFTTYVFNTNDIDEVASAWPGVYDAIDNMLRHVNQYLYLPIPGASLYVMADDSDHVVIHLYRHVGVPGCVAMLSDITSSGWGAANLVDLVDYCSTTMTNFEEYRPSDDEVEAFNYSRQCWRLAPFFLAAVSNNTNNISDAFQQYENDGAMVHWFESGDLATTSVSNDDWCSALISPGPLGSVVEGSTTGQQLKFLRIVLQATFAITTDPDTFVCYDWVNGPVVSRYVIKSDADHTAAVDSMLSNVFTGVAIVATAVLLVKVRSAVLLHADRAVRQYQQALLDPNISSAQLWRMRKSAQRWSRFSSNATRPVDLGEVISLIKG